MAGYAGNIKFKSFLGDIKVKGYLGDVKIFGSEFIDMAQVMSEAWVCVYDTGTLGKRHSTESTMYDSVGGAGWADTGHQLVVVLKDACVPTALKFHTPKIVNSGQSQSITYKIFGSNDDWNTTPNKMSWDTLVDTTTIPHSGFGDVDISLPIETDKKYKYIRLETSWFYGANNYHGVAYGSLQLWGLTEV